MKNICGSRTFLGSKNFSHIIEMYVVLFLMLVKEYHVQASNSGQQKHGRYEN